MTVKLIFPVLIALLSNAAYADEKDWLDINNGDVTTEYKMIGDKLVMVTKAIISYDIKTLKKVLLQCEKHSQFIEGYKSCANQHIDENTLYGKIVIQPPLIKNLSYYLYTTVEQRQDIFTITWKMDIDKKTPYIRDTYGFWKVQSVDARTHMVTLYSDTDFNFHWSINWLLEPILKSVLEGNLPQLMKNVRARIETNEQWRIGDDIPAPLITLQKGEQK